MLPKFYKTCQCQGHNKDEYMNLHLELRLQADQDNQDGPREEKENNKKFTKKRMISKRRFVNNSSRWNPTNKRLKLEKDSNKFLTDKASYISPPNKGIIIDNAFKVLLEEEKKDISDLKEKSQAT